MIKKLNLKIRTHLSQGIFHDTRKDCDALAKALEIAIAKINELVEAVNKLEGK